MKKIAIFAGFAAFLGIVLYFVLRSRPQYVLGDLKLVAKYEPLGLNVYVDTESTNRSKDFAIGQGDHPILLQEHTSNGFSITYSEKGRDVLETFFDTNGNVLKRFVYGRDNDSSKVRCIYADTNGDGLFDVFFVYSENGARTTVVRSNFCWIPTTK